MTPVRGFQPPSLLPAAPPMDEVGQLAAWEARAVHAVGSVIEFWGFKRNQGRVWALLYLRGQPLTAAEIQRELGLSKGAVSIITRELEQWNVLRRIRGGRSWRFEAEQDLLTMVRRVLESREQPLLQGVLHDLADADQAARAADRPLDDLDRLARVRQVAELFSRALEVFLLTAHLDLEDTAAALRAGPPSRKG